MYRSSSVGIRYTKGNKNKNKGESKPKIKKERQVDKAGNGLKEMRKKYCFAHYFNQFAVFNVIKKRKC